MKCVVIRFLNICENGSQLFLRFPNAGAYSPANFHKTEIGFGLFTLLPPLLQNRVATTTRHLIFILGPYGPRSRASP